MLQKNSLLRSLLLHRDHIEAHRYDTYTGHKCGREGSSSAASLRILPFRHPDRILGGTIFLCSKCKLRNFRKSRPWERNFVGIGQT